MVNQLPIVDLNGKKFFRDDRLRQFRNIENPHDFVDFEDVSDEI